MQVEVVVPKTPSKGLGIQKYAYNIMLKISDTVLSFSLYTEVYSCIISRSYLQ